MARDDDGSIWSWCEAAVAPDETAVRLAASEELLRELVAGKADTAAAFWGDATALEETVQRLEQQIASETNLHLLLVLLDDWRLARPGAACFPLPLRAEIAAAIKWAPGRNKDIPALRVSFK